MMQIHLARTLLWLPAILIVAYLATSDIAKAQRFSIDNEKQRVVLKARLSEGGPVIENGLQWRIFQANQALDANLTELKSSDGGTKAFEMEPGDYLVHAAYGHAGVVRRISVGSLPLSEEFVLNAGGFRLKATATGNVPIPARMLRFDIYEEKQDENGNRKLLAKNIKPDEVVPFPVGTYHVISRFGQLNAEVRADLRVQPGNLTEATMTHRAALIRFRLVRHDGGDAIPDTAWSILTENGEVIKESERTFPSMALAEGNYTAIAKNNDSIYSHDFEVRSGFNETVEVKALN
jgi:hypothetical protein